MEYKIVEHDERYFLGVEFQGGVSLDSNPKLGQLWNEFLGEDIKLIKKDMLLDKFIGLECYPPDFNESKTYDYFALVETKELVKQPGFVSKKLPKGKYISFVIKFDEITTERIKVYKYIAENKIHYHPGFDIEDYLEGQDYRTSGAILQFSLLLEE